MPFSITPNVHVETDKTGRVRHIRHLEEPYLGEPTVSSAPALAVRYLREVADIYEFDPSLLPPTEDVVAEVAPANGAVLQLAEEKELMGTQVVSFAQTYRGLPIYEAGFSASLNSNPLRVTSSHSTVHRHVDLHEPEPDGDGLSPENATPERVSQLLGVERESTRKARREREDEPRLVRINGARALIYRYDPDLRIDPESRTSDSRPLGSGPPTLALREVPSSIVGGRHYLVTEVLFTLEMPVLGQIHWGAFFERHTGAVLYLRAFVACADALVYLRDPVTAANGPLPNGPLAALNALRNHVSLADLPPQVGGANVALSGRFIRLADFSPPVAPPPTEPFGHFLYQVNTDNFSAANAYYHLDSLFRLMESMGFVVADYFDDTSFNPGFPLPADHAAIGGAVNAFSLGNTTNTGSGGFIFGHASAAANLGIADDARVVAHEFCHALLWDSVHSPNFGFAHSAGDSIGALLNDPGSHAPDRFVTFPWVPLVGRRHDRQVALGWGWGGINDTGGYNSEQILCTSHFRLYESTGGDNLAELAVQQQAARYIVYLIIRAIGSLATSPITPSPTPDVFVTALMNADIGTGRFDDQPGGCCVKAIRWAFEQQGLFQPLGAPVPVTTPGAPPAVDVFIDDGRNGQYTYSERFWDTTTIWNRHHADHKPEHQTPVVGEHNYAYVRVRNRGTNPATNVRVHGYHCRPGMGLVWPDDWTPMHTASVAVPGPIAPGAEVVVGPFQWEPRVEGHESLLMSVSAAGDLANTDRATFFPCASGPTPLYRLVPFDNNLGQRAVVPVPGGGGREELVDAFEERRLWANNPFDHPARIEIRAHLPSFLQLRGWQVVWDGAGAAPFTLGPREARELRPRLVSGQNFTGADVALAGQVAIEILELANGLVVGGSTYVLDPDLREPPRERREDEDEHEEAEEREQVAVRHNHVVQARQNGHEHVEEGAEEERPRRIRFSIDLV